MARWRGGRCVGYARTRGGGNNQARKRDEGTKDAAGPGARRRNQRHACRDGAGGESGRADARQAAGASHAVGGTGKEKGQGRVPFALLPGCYWVPHPAAQPSAPGLPDGLPPSLPVTRRGVQVRFRSV
jgi:hypothetical protein